MGRPSNTMEYAYDDWCLAQMANHLGHTDDYNYFLKRSANWTNLFDTETGFIRPKDKDGNWISPFDPYHTPGFTEGNAFIDKESANILLWHVTKILGLLLFVYNSFSL